MFGNKDKEKSGRPDTPAASTPPAATAPAKPASPAAPATTPAAPPAQGRVERTVLGEGAKFTGNLSVHGSVVVDGEFEGTLECTESLIVGKNGKVKADIEVRDAQVSGRVEGVIHARERVELEEGSHLEGDVHAKSFMIQDGVFFQGNCSMGEAVGQPSKSKPVAKDEAAAPELGILKQS